MKKFSVFSFIFMLLNTGYWPLNTAAADWPQLQRDAARTGYTPDYVPLPHDLLWTVEFMREGETMAEDISYYVQPVVYQGRVYAGTKAGYLHCVQAADGKQVWEFKAGGPILHSAGCAAGMVIFGSLDGNVYALDAATGQLRWKFAGAGGFSSAPCILEDSGVALLGCRSGVFYALEVKTGARLWEHDAGAPILGSAASDGKLVCFEPEDLKVRALEVKTGKLIWTSEPLNGTSHRGLHPVLHKGRVIVQNHIFTGHGHQPGAAVMYDMKKAIEARREVEGDITGSPQPPGWPETTMKTEEELAAAGMPGGKFDLGELARFRLPEKYFEAQALQAEWYVKNKSSWPGESLFVLDAASGKKQGVAPQRYCQSLNGAMPAPAVDCEGLVIIPWLQHITGWGRLDVESLRLVDYLLPPRICDADQSSNISCGGPFVYVLTTIESTGTSFSGSVDLRTRQWHNLRGQASGSKWSLYSTYPGGHAAAIADGRFFHIAYRGIRARGRPAK